MKVIFVGVHNKPYKQPLDSTTKTGKIIDKIISKINVECIKSNLYDCDYLPKDNKEKCYFANSWNFHFITYTDIIIVLLGKEVQQNFICTCGTIIRVAHPASLYGNEKTEQYINNIVKSINKIINH